MITIKLIDFRRSRIVGVSCSETSVKWELVRLFTRYFSLQRSQHSKATEERQRPPAAGTGRALGGTGALGGSSSQLPRPPPPSPVQVQEEELPPPSTPSSGERLCQHRLPAGLDCKLLICNQQSLSLLIFMYLKLFTDLTETNHTEDETM